MERRCAEAYERLPNHGAGSGRVTKGTFEEGYRDGWLSVAGDEPLPANPTRPPPDDESSMGPFQLGFLYGRADALERFQPAS
jgi:hypothetical protein